MAANPLPVEHPLVTQLVQAHGAVRLDEAGLEEFMARPGESVLFFTDDPVRFREVPDVAVILPQLRRAAARDFRIGVLPPPLANAIAPKYGVRRWPALAFVRGGEWLGNIEGLRDWADYLAAVDALLEAPAKPLPARVIPLASAAPSCG